MINLINVNSIINNSNNPRKDLGDLTELRDSIRVNGVLQPLTVVPIEGGYKVVIGHRRLEAARQAECEEVPCIIEDWSEEEQLNVMMMENMLREQLTTYEEAKGFQMMLDLGKSVEQIAEETGFSQTTVRNRTKLLSLDEKKFKESVQRGATLSDLTKLYDIDDEHTRNAVLKSAGTAEFNSKLNTAIVNQEMDKKVAAAYAEVSQWATEIASKADIDKPMRYVGAINKYSVHVPTHEEDKTYYLIKAAYGYDIYVEGEDTEEAERKARAERDEMIRSSLCAEAKACYDLRLQFIQNFGNFRKYGKTILNEFVKVNVFNLGSSGYRPYNMQTLGDILGIENLEENLNKLNDFTPDKVMLCTIMVYMDEKYACTWDSHWTKDGYEYWYEGNEKLMNWYAFLLSIGYQPSEQEQKLLNGDVEYVIKKEADVA